MDTTEYSFIFESKFREWNDAKLLEFQTTDGTEFSMSEAWILANRKKRRTPLQKILFRKDTNHDRIYRISVEVSPVSDPRASRKFKVSRNTNPVSTSIIILLKKYRKLKFNHMDGIQTNVYGVEINERVLTEEFRYRIILVRASGPPERGYPKVDRVLALSNDLETLLETSHLSDVLLTDGSLEIRSHRDIVFTRFEYCRIIEEHWQKNNEGVIKINEASPSVLKELIHYIYSGTTRPMDFDTLYESYRAADEYLLLDLKEMLSIQITRRIDPLNAAAVLALAHLHDESEMKASCLDVIVKNFDEVSLTERWKSFEKDEGYSEIVHEVREALIQRFGQDVNVE